MKIKFILLIVIVFQAACKNKTENLPETFQPKPPIVSSQKEKTKVFDFNNFNISKGKIGEIKVGMNIPDAENILGQLTQLCEVSRLRSYSN
jgi:hypothetical protein